MIRRIIAAMLILASLLSLFSCDPHDYYQGDHDDPHNDIQNDPSSNVGEGNVTYVYNITSLVLHIPSCYHVRNMKEELKVEFKGDVNTLLKKGYRFCKICLMPDENNEKPEDEVIENENSTPNEYSTYGINLNTRVFHDLDCHYLKNLSSANRTYTFLTYEELISLDYKPCGSCLKDKD